MNFEQYQKEEDRYRFLRTSCGLIGFITFFLGAFFSFISAEETKEYYDVSILLGIALLCVTAAFFCCVLHESKRVFELTEAGELVSLVAKSSAELQQEHQLKGENVDNLRWPTDDSDEIIDSDNNCDPDMQALQKMKKCGLSAKAKESASETRKRSQDKGLTCSGDKSSNVEIDPAMAGPSKVNTNKSSEEIESRPNISPSKGLFKPSQ